MSFCKTAPPLPTPLSPRGGCGVGGRGIIHIVFAAPKGTVFASYRSKKQMAGIDFAQILSGIGYGSVERYFEFRSFEFKMSKKERLNSNGSF